MTGYSGTPLAAKLGIKAGMAVRIVHAPKNYRELLAPLPDGARLSTAAGGKTDFVHHFASRKSELARALRSYRRELGANTPVWISWPKKTSQVPTDITEDTIRVKLVVRKELR
ncbi:MAG: hypothetical protein WD944_05980 [Steroidobacteraceae bacterium]